MRTAYITSEDKAVRLRVDADGYVVGCVGANSHAYVIARAHACACTRFINKRGKPVRLYLDTEQNVKVTEL
jgi:hypothetical protein